MSVRWNDGPLAGARAVVARLEHRQAAHVKACAQCAEAGRDVHKRCGDGWQLAKELSRAKYAAQEAISRAEIMKARSALW